MNYEPLQYPLTASTSALRMSTDIYEAGLLMLRVGTLFCTPSVSSLGQLLLPETGDLGLGDMSGSLLQQEQHSQVTAP